MTVVLVFCVIILLPYPLVTSSNPFLFFECVLIPKTTSQGRQLWGLTVNNYETLSLLTLSRK